MNDHPGGDTNNLGHCTTRPYNHYVLLEFSTKLEDCPRGWNTVYHEVLHMALARLDYATDYVCKNLPKNLRDTLPDTIEREQEAMVSQISRGIVRYVGGEK
jgi:hypothetical protein